ncbi:unnamed protein product [Pedinophyceae sp. YPF-701]|nr:unnamed protein product [Pedinophyceae sp. YPF-701]
MGFFSRRSHESDGLAAGRVAVAVAEERAKATSGSSGDAKRRTDGTYSEERRLTAQASAVPANDDELCRAAENEFFAAKLSVPIQIPGKHGDQSTASSVDGYGFGFRPPHELTKAVADIDPFGESPTCGLKRERLKHRSKVLIATGFVERDDTDPPSPEGDTPTCQNSQRRAPGDTRSPLTPVRLNPFFTFSDDADEDTDNGNVFCE